MKLKTIPFVPIPKKTHFGLNMKKHVEDLCSLKTTRRFRETRKETNKGDSPHSWAGRRDVAQASVRTWLCRRPASRGQFPQLLTGLGKQPVTRVALPRASAAQTASRQMRLGDGF